MLDKKLKKCPQCGRNKLQRLIGGGSGIIFKGSGFYETDYKKKKPLKPESDHATPDPDLKTAKPSAEKCPLSDTKTCKGCEKGAR